MVDIPRKWTGVSRYAAVATVLLALLLFSFIAYGAPEIAYGDVNNDGKIDVKDVLAIMKHILELETLTGDQLKAADVNGDGKVDVRDASLVMKKALGIIDRLPMPIVSVEEVSIFAPYGTSLANIDFPSTVKVTLHDQSTEKIDVKWETTSTPAYDPYVYGNYVFKGELVNLPQGVTNPDKIQAKAIVVVSAPWLPWLPAPVDPDPPVVDTYTLTMNVNPPNSGTVTGAGVYAQGTAVNISATANSGFVFSHWTADAGSFIYANDPVTVFTMPGQNVTVTANFISTLVSATINPTELVYDLSDPDDVETVITWNDASAVEDVVFEGTPLAAADYTVTDIDGNTATLAILNSFFVGENPAAGDVLVFTIEFDAGADAVLTVTVVDSEEPLEPWPEEIDGEPIITYLDLVDTWMVRVPIKAIYQDLIISVTILGEPASPTDDRTSWWAAFDYEVTLDDLRGQIVIVRDALVELDVIDMANTRAVLGLLNDTYVRVTLKAGEVATSVTADGVNLTYDAVNDRWQSGALYGYSEGDTIEVVVTTADGTQTVELTVEEIS